MEPVSRDDLTLGSNAVLIATVVDECETNHKVLVSLEKLSVPVLGSIAQRVVIAELESLHHGDPLGHSLV